MLVWMLAVLLAALALALCRVSALADAQTDEEIRKGRRIHTPP